MVQKIAQLLVHFEISFFFKYREYIEFARTIDFTHFYRSEFIIIAFVAVVLTLQSGSAA